METYDVIIVGGGPAGLTAGMYAARGGMKTLLLESTFSGGQMINAMHIDNYPALPETNGPELAMRMQQQAQSFGAQIVTAQVQRVELAGQQKRLYGEKDAWAAKAVILCMGNAPRRLEISAEQRLAGRGVSYCATCDGAFFKGKTVAVIGGGDTAIEDAMFLSALCGKVYIVHRRDALRAVDSLQKAVMHKQNVEILWNSVIKDIQGEQRVEGMRIENVQTKAVSDIMLSAVFVAIGGEPSSALIKGVVETDEAGYIVTDELMRTGIPGVFAAGDVRKKTFRQIVTAASDGAIAAAEAQKYAME